MTESNQRAVSKNELLCRECGYLGFEALIAPNPFDKEDILEACPECLEINSLRMVCEIQGCKKEADCGTPTDKGYVRCCGDHYIALQG